MKCVLKQIHKKRNSKIKFCHICLPCVPSVPVRFKGKENPEIHQTRSLADLNGFLGFPFPKNAQERLLCRLHLFNTEGSRVLPLEIRNAYLALRIASLFEVMSSRATSSLLFTELVGRERITVNNCYQ